jgi:hypothetical protein
LAYVWSDLDIGGEVEMNWQCQTYNRRLRFEFESIGMPRMSINSNITGLYNLEEVRRIIDEGHQFVLLCYCVWLKILSRTLRGVHCFDHVFMVVN